MHKTNFDEADSTDWLDTPLRCLSPVDSALRCQVCKDFYTTPMITSCAHTFCSLCIRRCLSNDGRCPACRAQEQELKLRNNGAMEELVEAFKGARAEVLNYARISSLIPVSTGTPQKELENDSLNDETPPNKRTRYTAQPAQHNESLVIIHPEADGDYIDETGMVQCPICNFRLPEKQINAHLDSNCLKKPTSFRLGVDRVKPNAMAISNLIVDKPNKRPERLPQINFSLFKDVQLKKKLAEHGLSQTGSRQTMQKRYMEWITLWNANCDSKHPRGPRELRSELEKWERSQEGRGPGANNLPNYCSKIKEKDFDGKAWSESHNISFKELIEAARPKADQSQFPKTATLSHENRITAPDPFDSPALQDDLTLPQHSSRP